MSTSGSDVRRCVSPLDTSIIDLSKNSKASISFSNAALSDKGDVGMAPWVQACKLSSFGDPESPPCSRLTLLGKFEDLTKNAKEWNLAKAALNASHPQLDMWGCFEQTPGGKMPSHAGSTNIWRFFLCFISSLVSRPVFAPKVRLIFGRSSLVKVSKS